MKRYDFKNIEKKWREKWLADKTYEPDLDRASRPFYNLMMFPYPSAEGLHIGGVRTFTGVDIYGRCKRMQGHDVFEPIGLDGFGIHSENYAIKIGKHPKEHAADSEKNFYRQLSEIGNGFAWDKRLETYDPEYYRWTQWIFVQMFKAGLAYRKKASVNWCPKCATVLADEQVIAGECERCQTQVIKKDLEQWFFKITNYAERLLQGLDHIDWSEKVKIAQRNWIGKSEGAEIDFKIKNSDRVITIFTTRPDTLFGATYMVLSPEHQLISELAKQIQNKDEVLRYIEASRKKTQEERQEAKEKTGVELKGIKAINPANGEEIPIWVADYVLSGYGTGAIMAVPAHDERDFEFASKYELPAPIVICPHWPEKTCPILDEAYTGEGHLVASGKFDGMPSEEAKWKIAEAVGGKRKIQYRLRDWLISRQRYWGPPIPMIWCNKCAKWTPEREENLPVLLPDVKEFRPTGTDKSPLANFPEFYKTTCPECGGEARRETDVSDTFLDSAWYYLGYLILGDQKSNIKNQKNPFDNERISRWLPVHMYIGGAEHSVLHLLYVRFLSMALHDMEFVDFAKASYGDPISVFRAHGLITKDGAKMSKSRGNVVNPDDYFMAYGADAMRMYLAFMSPLTEDGDFRDDGIRGITRFLGRVWNYYNGARTSDVQRTSDVHDVSETVRLTHKTVKKVSEDIESLSYNTAISALMILLTQMEKAQSSFADVAFLLMLAPFAPHITEEIFELRGSKESIHKAPWPKYNPAMIQDETFELVIQINGKVRDMVEAPIDITEEAARSLALAREKVKTLLSGTAPKKIIFVPKRLINIVV